MAKKLSITKAKSVIHVKIKTSVERTIVAWSWSKKNYFEALVRVDRKNLQSTTWGALLAMCVVTKDVMFGDTNIMSGLNAGGCGA